MDHVIPTNSEILNQAIRRGLVSTPPSHMIGNDESESLPRVNAWVRTTTNANGLFVRPRLFMPYYEELKVRYKIDLLHFCAIFYCQTRSSWPACVFFWNSISLSFKSEKQPETSIWLMLKFNDFPQSCQSSCKYKDFFFPLPLYYSLKTVLSCVQVVCRNECTYNC